MQKISTSENTVKPEDGVEGNQNLFQENTFFLCIPDIFLPLFTSEAPPQVWKQLKQLAGAGMAVGCLNDGKTAERLKPTQAPFDIRLFGGWEGFLEEKSTTSLRLPSELL